MRSTRSAAKEVRADFSSPRMAVTPEDGQELPDWFVVELFRDLPRLADKRNG